MLDIGNIISSNIPPSCIYRYALPIPFRSYIDAVTVDACPFFSMRLGRSKADITGGSARTFWVVFKNPAPTRKESELTSFETTPPILFIMPTESLSVTP